MTVNAVPPPRSLAKVSTIGLVTVNILVTGSLSKAILFKKQDRNVSKRQGNNQFVRVGHVSQHRAGMSFARLPKRISR